MRSRRSEASKVSLGGVGTESRPTYKYQSPDVLRTDPKNPRHHTDNHIAAVARSIKEFTFLMPAVVDHTGQIVAGEARVLAARKLGLGLIPTIEVSHLTPDQLRAYRIADNRLAEKSEWDEKKLAFELNYLIEIDLGFSIETVGYETAEIDLVIGSLNDEEAKAGDDRPLPENPPEVADLGDLWALGRHKVLCGDARDSESLKRLFGEERAAMSLLDVPFNVKIHGHATGNGRIKHREFPMASGEMSKEQYTEFLKVSFERVAEFSRDGSLHYFFEDWRHIGELMAAGGAVFGELMNLIVWAKSTGGLGSLYRSQHELIFLFRKGTARHRNNIQLGRFGRNRTNVWQYAGMNSPGQSGQEGSLQRLHPTPKPVQLVADAILDCTERGDIVVDTFLGSGTTLLAAEKTGRRCFGIELDPLYVDLTIHRWELLTGKKARVL